MFMDNRKDFIVFTCNLVTIETVNRMHSLYQQSNSYKYFVIV